MKKAPVVHFEMPAKDNSRVAKFYEEAFGWKMQQMGSEFGNYLMAQSADTDDKGMNKTPGTINGGFFKYENKEGFNVPHLVLSVDNLNESMEAVKNAGGEILGEPMDIPKIGKYVSIKDTEGNIVGMLLPSRPQ
jgi:uncharacterized protein